MTKVMALELSEEWEKCVKQKQAGLVITATWISSHVVRPFLFFITCLSIRKRRIEATEVDSMKSCFQMLLDSMNSTGMVLFSFVFGWIVFAIWFSKCVDLTLCFYVKTRRRAIALWQLELSRREESGVIRRGS